MKIAYFLDLNWILGGAGNVLIEQAKIMNKIHEVIMVIPCDERKRINQEYLLRCQKANLKYVILFYITTHCIQNIDIINAWSAVEEIKRFARNEHIDIFHSVQLNIGVELASRELKIPHLMNIYQLRKEEFILNGINIFPRYHSCDSQLYCNVWKNELGMKTCCIRPSAPLDYIKKKKRENKDILEILMLGGFMERKNQMAAIQAVEYCNKNGYKINLTIAGSDTNGYARECIEYVRKKHLYKNIFIIGFYSDVVPLLEENDCYLCTSKDESFPSSIVEAITYDLTIISTPVAGVPELLKNGINAYISDGYEMQDIANSIMACYQDYQNFVIENIHKEAESLWKENFATNIIREKLNHYYFTILKDYSSHSETFIEEKISKQDIKEIYDKLVEMNGVIPEILSRCYYYACLKTILSSGNAYIWGAGKYGEFAKKILEMLFPQIAVLAYIDKKKTGTYLGIPIIQPEQIEEVIDYIFIGFRESREEVIEDLERKNWKYNENVWLLP